MAVSWNAAAAARMPPSSISPISMKAGWPASPFRAWRASRRAKSRTGLIRNPADGAAEALFGIAASLTDGQSADVSILYLRMALYLRPDLGLAQVLLADRFESLRKFDTAIGIYRGIDPSSPYYRMAQVQAALDQQRLGNNDDAIADLKKLVTAEPNGQRKLGGAGRHLPRVRQIRRKRGRL